MELILAIFQVIILIVNFGIARNAYSKSRRLQTDIGRKEGKRDFIFASITLMLSIGLTAALFLNSKYQATEQKSNFDTLKTSYENLLKKNDKLEAAIINEVDSTTATVVHNAADNALKATNQIVNSTDKLNQLITGTDLPLIPQTPSGYTVVKLQLSNENKFAAINVSGSIFNYDKMLTCPINYEKRLIDYNCLTNTGSPVSVPYLASGITWPVELPYYDPLLKQGRFTLLLRVKNNTYYTEFLYRINGSDLRNYWRIYKINLKTTTFFSQSNPSLSNSEWERLFPIHEFKLADVVAINRQKP